MCGIYERPADVATPTRVQESITEERVAWDGGLQGFVAQFQAGTLSKEDWTHDMHLSIGLYYVFTYGLERGYKLMAEGIRTVNAKHGQNKGFHETITRAYLVLLADFVDEYGPAPITQLNEQMLESGLSDRMLLFDFYSKDRLMSHEARTGFVEPDLKPLRAGEYAERSKDHVDMTSLTEVIQTHAVTRRIEARTPKKVKVEAPKLAQEVLVIQT